MWQASEGVTEHRLGVIDVSKVSTGCAFAECEREVHCKELCMAHYQQRQAGKELRPIRKRSVALGMTDRERFDSRVDKSGTCWVWTATKTRDGYGRFRVGGRLVQAHRVSYEWARGPIPAGSQVDHRCFNKSCVNPEHLRAVTNKQNQENRAPRTTTRSGHRGVSWYARTGKWRAQVVHEARIVHLGYFDDLEEAALIATAARAELFTHSDGR